jgi:hypothetical protein
MWRRNRCSGTSFGATIKYRCDAFRSSFESHLCGFVEAVFGVPADKRLELKIRTRIDIKEIACLNQLKNNDLDFSINRSAKIPSICVINVPLH